MTINKLFNSQPIFSGPFKRAELLLLPQYAASDDFAAAGKWEGLKSHVLSLNSCEAGDTTQPLYCIVVGMVSAEKAFLGKHGNFSSKYNDSALKAKIQFTITQPNDADFGPDFDKAITAFEEYQREISESPYHRYFILKEEGNGMRMNFPLFEPKVGGDNIKNKTSLMMISIFFKNMN